jgi:tetratricopeptide (TPR) repeat protein
VVLASFLTLPDFPSWWESDRWLQRFGDVKTTVFAWSGPTKRWPKGELQKDWDRLAFGPRVPADYRPPLHGPSSSPKEPGVFDSYIEGVPPVPQSSQELDLKRVYYNGMAERSKVPFEFSMIVVPATMAPLTGTVGPLVEASHLTNSWRSTLLFAITQAQNSQRGFYRVNDAGPPAVPVLMVRLARQAVAEQPENDRCYRQVVSAYQTLQGMQEAHWAGNSADDSLRGQLRRLQVITALRSAVVLSPEDWQLHRFLAQLYHRQYYLDLALEHFMEAERRLEALRPSDPKQLEGFQAEKQRMEDQRKLFEIDVSKRLADYELKAATVQGANKYRLALHAPYKLIDKKNQESIDRQGRGLALVALKVVQDLPVEALEPAERLEIAVGQIELLLNMGRAHEVAQELPPMKEFLGPNYHQLKFLTAGALGHYDEMMAPLQELEKQASQRLSGSVGQAFAFGHISQIAPLTEGYSSLGHPTPSLYIQAMQQWNNATMQLFDLQTLRGITALEFGDTEAAHTILSDTMRQAGNAYFPDRTIAERYLHYLRQQRPPSQRADARP